MTRAADYVRRGVCRYFVAGKRHGAGLYKYPCGSVYEGEYVAGKRCGIGTLSTVQGFRFSGFWTDGRRSGLAKAAYPDGSIFDGQYKDDRRHGLGKVTFSNGDCFEGLFENDLPNGMGKYYHHGFGTYYGTFKNGMRSGSGAEMESVRKEGDLKWRSFDGVFEFAKGDAIVVNWKQGLPHGYGVCVVYSWLRAPHPLLRHSDTTAVCRYQFSDGLQFKGLWKDGRRDGKGIL